jgi:hypothetical protein
MAVKTLSYIKVYINAIKAGIFPAMSRHLAAKMQGIGYYAKLDNKPGLMPGSIEEFLPCRRSDQCGSLHPVELASLRVDTGLDGIPSSTTRLPSL